MIINIYHKISKKINKFYLYVTSVYLNLSKHS